MSFIADLHIHSRYSMATSRDLTLPHLAGWAMRKGINVLGTGDFTHPAWRKELASRLEPVGETGLYRLKDAPILPPGPRPMGKSPLFCLQSEISCVYKRDGKTRRVHNLVFMPDMESAQKFSRKLEAIGNLAGDGRPILGLDSRDLLEIALETSEAAVFIPAHIWTPWYAVFGSKSGFDSLEACYGPLTSHIFALETGLSSDPAMNRLLSALDGYALISNSDAHSGANLGREANLFSGQPDYFEMFNALRSQARRVAPASGSTFLGTLEYYPEEGKYHLDGHRKCGISLTPQETAALGNICPICGKPLTVGVLHRVMDLADRDHELALLLEPETRMLVPLPEVVGEIMGAGPKTLGVSRKCAEIASQLASELEVLCILPEDQIRNWWEPLGEAVSRIRARKLAIRAGFDGEYGKIGIFEPGELTS